MVDVLFITPTETDNVLKESVGTLLLSTILREKGVQVEILPFCSIGNPTHLHDFLDTAIDMICRKQPKIVSFYTRSDTYHIMLKLSERIKKQMSCYIVFGGPQADITAKETLEEIPYVDFICCGEGETTVYPFFSSLLNGKPDLSVRGLVYRSGGQIIANPRPELIADLDSLPLLDYSVFSSDARLDNRVRFPIDVGRGCPFGCTYCSTKTFWGRKYRLKSPARIVKELKHYHDQFGVTHFVFQHDMFTMNRKLVMETCRLIQALDFTATWSCSARVDCIDEDLIDVMAASGLRNIYLGVETGSPRMQKLINKNLNLDKVIKILSYIHSKNIRITTSFMFGFPEETEEDISQTISLVVEILKIRKIVIQMHLCAFLPGTALFEQYKERLVPATSFSDMTGTAGVEECADLIQSHPQLFMYFNEYKTELRTKMQFLPIFVYVFQALRTAYLYFAEKYPKDRLIEMYLDFAEGNKDILTASDLVSDEEKFHRIVKNDAFAKRFSDDAYADVVADIYRMEAARLSVLYGETTSATEICGISPIDLSNCTSLQECPRALCMVSYSKDENGLLKMKVHRT